MYIYLFSMLLSHISYKNYFENFPKSKIPFSAYCFRPGRSTDRSIETCVQDVHACARLSVDRPVDRLEPCCSLFLVGRPGRSTDGSKRKFPFAAGRPSPTAICQLGCRLTGRSTDSRPGAPTALSSLVNSNFVAFLYGRNF